MQKQKKGRLQKLANLLEIPQDIVLDLPRITMLGNKQLLVENHKGIIEYSPSVVRIKLNQSELVVSGHGMAIDHLQAEQLLIEGTIEVIKYDS